MRLIFLHGPPASGKYTIARELEAEIGARNFHNHLTVDVAKALFEFGSEPFWDLLRELRAVCVAAMCEHLDTTIVYTSVYSHPEDEASVKRIESMVESAGGRFLPIFLQCDVEELERRVSDPSRIERHKITSVDGLRRALETWNCIGLPKKDCLNVVTDGKSPRDCAREIIDCLEKKTTRDGEGR